MLAAQGLNPFITAQGYSLTAMFSVLIGAVVNIILDPMFIFALGMGVNGASLATVLSSVDIVPFGVICFFLFQDVSIFRFKLGDMKPDARRFFAYCRSGFRRS